MKLYNTLSRSIEDFVPLNPPKVGIYTCGPTVYDFAHIGHMRKYVGDDILVRILRSLKYDVKHVMNITDVGHLTSDSDFGEDKMEKGARKYKMSVWEIAKKFEQQFFSSARAMNIKKPDVIMNATDYITDQIGLISVLEQKKFTYLIPGDGVYFDTSKFPNYFALSHQTSEELKAGARVEMIQGKRNASDFALWKLSYPNGRSFDSAQDDPASRRQMEWESPWGVGFPGWHIECSAMSMKELGVSFDIHTGGIDHIPIHHTNEIAQSEAATGRPFVKYWVHHAFLLVEGEKMSKSLGNIYTVDDIVAKGYSAMALRYLFLTTHYRQEMNFTFQALEAAGTALSRLISDMESWDEQVLVSEEYKKLFMDAVTDDMNLPRAIAVFWEMTKSDLPSSTKMATLLEFDDILGLGISYSRKELIGKKNEKIPNIVMQLVRERELSRAKKDYEKADILRNRIKKMGYEIIDGDNCAAKIRKI